jgi:hypothetical protein
MATTQQKTNANRANTNQANARRSTGPRTAAGKSKSSRNARKHGLCAENTLLPGENIDDFRAHVAALEDLFQPADALEHALLRQLADAEWRMRRVPRLEAAAFANKLHEARRHYDIFPDALPNGRAQAETFLIGSTVSGDGGEALAKLSRYEARLSHRFFRALDQLRQAQSRRTQGPPDPQQSTEAEKPPESQRRPAPHRPPDPQNQPQNQPAPQPSAPKPPPKPPPKQSTPRPVHDPHPVPEPQPAPDPAPTSPNAYSPAPSPPVAPRKANRANNRQIRLNRSTDPLHAVVAPERSTEHTAKSGSTDRPINGSKRTKRTQSSLCFQQCSGKTNPNSASGQFGGVPGFP